jgi:eukaryotic translation initiation factor 2C
MRAYQNMGQGTPPKIPPDRTVPTTQNCSNQNMGQVIIAQKNHHTKLFQADAPDNVPPGMQLSSVKQKRTI